MSEPIDIDMVEQIIQVEKLVLCRRGPERWVGGMAAHEDTYMLVYGHDVVLALLARIRELEARTHPDECMGCTRCT